MISRYTRPEMDRIWREENKFSTWLAVEIAVCEAQAKLGIIPNDALKEIKEKAAFDITRIDQLEAEVHHDVIAFLTSVAEKVGPASKYIHYGLTSSDVVDTALSLQMKQAIELIIDGTTQLIAVLKQRALIYKNTFMAGRTHGVHAEPTTFGLKLLIWYFEMKRNLTRLEQAKEVISVGKISGAVGNYANINSQVEAKVCEKFCLNPATVSNQVLQRDRHAQYLTTLAIVGASLEKFATEIRNLQRTEILEVEEPFVKGQKGSSAMPHKRNPVTCERICGLARILRANAMAALENVALWHERDISHSSVERVIIPDSTILLDYMLDRFKHILEELQVYPQNMMSNLERTGGLVFSQQVLLALVEKGATREEAYRLIQRNAMKTWQEKSDFRENLLNDDQVRNFLSAEEIAACFDLDYYLRNVDLIFERISE